ncbi:MAG TPA: superoxide dismutase family protein [Burkholderiales bacterium]|nr:superoxide dismutase family protein [Burkholderiales bacterium]
MKRFIVLLACCGLVAACSNMNVRSPTATAVLAPTKGSQVAGNVKFVQRGERVLVDARVTGLTPGLHGFHVHEKGDCTAADATSAGGHFNPRKAPHAGPDIPERHAGDLGNLNADASGVAVYHAEVGGISLGTAIDSIVGRAVIVHANPDDLRTQPTGNSGARLACGLISKGQDQWF